MQIPESSLRRRSRGYSLGSDSARKKAAKNGIQRLKDARQLTLYVERFATTQVRIASLPTGTVTFVIGALKLGPSETGRRSMLSEPLTTFRYAGQPCCSAIKARVYRRACNARLSAALDSAAQHQRDVDERNVECR
jgi:hypothetical protein